MPDIDQVQKALEEYYRKKFQDAKYSEISEVKHITAGMGNRMYSFLLECVREDRKFRKNLILRMNESKQGKLKEFRTLEKLNSTSIPTPKVYDAGEDMLGYAFIIMEKMKGRNMLEFMDSIIEDEQSELWEQFSRALAEIHMLDWAKAGLGFLDPPEGRYGYADALLNMFDEWSESMKIHDLRSILDWLSENKPPSSHYVLLHGDYYPGNILIHEGMISGIVDWEGVHIGEAAFDVCEVPFVLRTSYPPGERFESLADSFLEYYRKITGDGLENLDFYLALKSVFFLFIFLSRTDVEGEWRNTVIQSCCTIIEEKTGIRVAV